MIKILSFSIACCALPVQQVVAADQEISLRCANGVVTAVAQLEDNEKMQSVELMAKYRLILCDDRGDYLSIRFRIAATDAATIRDGEDYFLIDASRW